MCESRFENLQVVLPSSRQTTVRGDTVRILIQELGLSSLSQRVTCSPSDGLYDLTQTPPDTALNQTSVNSQNQRWFLLVT